MLIDDGLNGKDFNRHQYQLIVVYLLSKYKFFIILRIHILTSFRKCLDTELSLSVFNI